MAYNKIYLASSHTIDTRIINCYNIGNIVYYTVKVKGNYLKQ